MLVKRKPVKARGTTQFHLQARRMVNHAWSNQEDGCLADIVNTLGAQHWAEISKSGRQAGVLFRDSKSCRLRWINQLSDEYRKDPFVHAEDYLICQIHAVIGDRWAEIAKRLVRRSDNQVKNRFNSHIIRLCPEMLRHAYKQHSLRQLPQELYDDLRNLKKSASWKRKKQRAIFPVIIFSDCTNDLTGKASSELEVGLPTTTKSEGSTELSADSALQTSSDDTSGETSFNWHSGLAHIWRLQGTPLHTGSDAQTGACSSKSTGALTWQKMHQDAIRMGCTLEDEDSFGYAEHQQWYQASMPIHNGVVIAASTHRHNQFAAEPMTFSRVVQHPQGTLQEPRLEQKTASGTIPTVIVGHKSAFTAVSPDCSCTAPGIWVGSTVLTGLLQTVNGTCDQLKNTAKSHLKSAACHHLTNTLHACSWSDAGDSRNTSCATSIPASAVPLGRRTLPATAQDESLSMLGVPCMMRAPAICGVEELGSSAGEAGSISATEEVEAAAADFKLPCKRLSSIPTDDMSHNLDTREPTNVCRARLGTLNSASGSPENTLRWTVRKMRSDPQTPRNSPAGQALGFSTARSSVLQAAPTLTEGSDVDVTEWCSNVREGSRVLLEFWRTASQAMENAQHASPPRNPSGRCTMKKKVSNYRVLNSAGFDKA